MTPPPNLDISSVAPEKRLAAVALLCFGFFAVSRGALHLLRPDYDPVVESVSHYAIGPYGYMMTLGFLVLGPGVMSVALGLLRTVKPRPQFGSLLLMASGVCVFLVGVFPVDQGPNAMPLSERIHDGSFMGSFVAVVVGMGVLSRNFRRDPQWQPIRHISMACFVAAALGLLLFVGMSDTAWRGLVQRLNILIVFVWFVVTATRLRFVAGQVGEPVRDQGWAESPTFG